VKWRAAIAAALEAIEVGDYWLATDILLGALEDGPRARPFLCACGQAFEWPGLRDAHADSRACPLLLQEAA
jgi:hypothetical protein